MIRSSRPLFLCVALACSSSTTGPGPLQIEPGSDSLLVIRNAHLVTMNSPGILTGQVVVVQGDRIAAIQAASAPIPEGATVIDAAGRYLMPGLIDMHVHILTEHLQGYIEHGVTSVRNMWGYRELPGVISSIQSGARLGPSIYSLSSGFNGSPARWPETQLSDDVTQIEALVNGQIQQGYRELKVYTNLNLAAFDTLVAVARRRGVTLAGHVPNTVTLRHAIESGMRSIEHLSGYVGAVTRGSQWVRADPIEMILWAQRTAAAGVWNCPTLAVVDVQDIVPFEFEARSRARRNMVKALHDAQAPLLVGTDAGFTGIRTMQPETIAEELRLFVQAGLTPYEALLGATRNAARYLGLNTEIGTISTGARADLILLSANPLANIDAVRRIDGVVLRGHWMPR